MKELREIIEYLSENKKKKCMIELSGNKNSGKTEFIKELGWFCHTRHLFGLGIYYIDLDDVREKSY